MQLRPFFPVLFYLAVFCEKLPQPFTFSQWGEEGEEDISRDRATDQAVSLATILKV